MRIRLTSKNRRALFATLSKRGLTVRAATAKYGVNARTWSDWRRGKSSLPASIFDKLLHEAKTTRHKLSPIVLRDFWHIKVAAKKGGLARYRLYGNFSTEDGRKKGGLASLQTHKENPSAFKVLKKIKIPGPSTKLAELLGILIGDGHLSEYQISVTTNAQTDQEHAQFSSKLLEDLLGVKTTLTYKKGERTINIVASSKNAVNILQERGMPIGNKIKHGVAVPRWIFRKEEYKRAFVRGLFDTDGCVYLDKHRVGRKTYKHYGWKITSYSVRLIGDIIQLLKQLGFSPTHRTSQKSVFLRRQGEIARYFHEIKTHNPKHAGRYRKLAGGVPKWS